MGYSVKWVEDNLGITRKVLRIYEANELIPKNEDGKRRDYSDDEIERIWNLRVLQTMGFSIKQIKDMINNEGKNFDNLLAEKIDELNEKKEQIEKSLYYAKTIKLTGRIPPFKETLGEETITDFKERSLVDWSMGNNKESRELLDAFETINECDKSNEIDNDSLNEFFNYFLQYFKMMSNEEDFFAYNIIPLEIIKRNTSAPCDAEVQLLIKMFYDTLNNMRSPKLTIDEFTKFAIGNFMYGDLGKSKIKTYGKDNCIFIANAIAIFGGYSSYTDIE